MKNNTEKLKADIQHEVDTFEATLRKYHKKDPAAFFQYARKQLGDLSRQELANLLKMFDRKTVHRWDEGKPCHPLVLEVLIWMILPGRPKAWPASKMRLPDETKKQEGE